MSQPDAKLAGQVAIVTGAGSGIGAASARALAGAGAQVVVADINPESATVVSDLINAAGGESIAVAADIASAEQVQQMVQAAIDSFGGLTILHNNAADTLEDSIRGDVNIVDLDVERLDRAYAVNLRGTFLCCKYSIPHLVAAGGGSIINTSTTSSLAGDLFLTAYGVTKAGINTLTQYIATQYGKHGVRCNAIVPGLTLTPSVSRNLDADMVEVYKNNIISREFAQPEDLAEVVLFLASAPDYVTGGLIHVNGGQLAHAPAFANFLDRGWGVPRPTGGIAKSVQGGAGQ
ncbi:MAG: dehydrogenase [Frankiales bacterium]|jgi:NAD(P)-dependent dehydrogenase (short-subunit alcohol dehydrogenase family)|nr:dehydrogenase [Frankiales bacterium]